MNKHKKELVTVGVPIETADKILIMTHGRGATATDILSVAQYLNVKDFAIIAPQATNYTWYPYSFLVPRQQNEPWLSSAIELLDEIVKDLEKAGKISSQIYFSGFSQGACLAVEYATRRARQWGGVAAFTGGLIGDTLKENEYEGNFGGTPVFLGSADPDPHVPVERVNDTARIMTRMNASVTKVIYPNMGHTISGDEISKANELIFP